MEKVTITITGMQHADEVAGVLSRLPDLTWGELAELVQFDRELTAAGGTCPACVLADQPVWLGHPGAGGVAIYRPTLASNAWAVARMDDWFAGEPAWAQRLLAWSLAHARDQASWAQMDCKASARRVLADWCAGLVVTVEELESAVAAALADFPRVVPASTQQRREGQMADEAGQGALGAAAALQAEHGGTLGYWLFDVSLQAVAWIRRESANAEAAAGGKALPGYVETLKALQAYRAELIGRHGERRVEVESTTKDTKDTKVANGQ